jgi:hypothetical protein
MFITNQKLITMKTQENLKQYDINSLMTFIKDYSREEKTFYNSNGQALYVEFVRET